MLVFKNQIAPGQRKCAVSTLEEHEAARLETAIAAGHIHRALRADVFRIEGGTQYAFFFDLSLAQELRAWLSFSGLAWLEKDATNRIISQHSASTVQAPAPAAAA